MLVGVRKRKKEMKLFKIHRENLYGRERRKRKKVWVWMSGGSL